ncbi:transcriptional repressor ILP1-like [Asparagus officinalis]|uniref:transcriptional repressor ILP1-like n=1 Tax=Asparagus officinalis TaxID=4686 RepID=UPI00098E2FE0|nr:transcriptional repressor ILP1-like [Asparagus officinalis]
MAKDLRKSCKNMSTGNPSASASSKNRAPSSGPTPPIPFNVQPQAGEYTKERLLELQKNARPLGSLPRPQKPDSPSKSEPVIVLKGLVKPTSSPIDPAPKPRKEEVEEESDETEEDKFAKLGIDGKGKGLSSIPSQADIAAIKARRERLRQSRGPAADFISLDSGGVMATRASDGGSSDEEDHEFRGRIALFGDKGDEKSKKGVFEEFEERAPIVESRVVGEIEAEDEEDEEERKWEEEQFRKGLGKRIEIIEEVSVHRGVSSVQPQMPPPQNLYPAVGPQPLVPGSTPFAQTMSISQQAEIATRALKESVMRLKDSHKRTMDSVAKTDENLAEALSDITTLEKSLQEAGDKYIFMQQLRDFISVTCDFLKDKALLGHTMSVLSKGSGPAYVSAATNAAHAALAAVRESSNLPVQLDEFGRDVNLQKRMDFSRRAEARKRRRARTDSRRMTSIGKQLEGEVTTDESDSESTAYTSTRDELLQTAEQIFSDAADEYSNLSVVKERFERWKKHYFSSYRDAYMSLSAPAVFSPYVRLELLKWDPLYNMTDFEEMKWYKLLFEYGLPGRDEDFDPEDADANLIPELVEKVALPILHHEILHCWDMFSTKRTENAVFATNLVVTYVPVSSKALQELLSVVCSRLTQAITNLSVPVWSSVVTRIVPGAAQLAAYRFGTSVRLLRNICLWKDVLSLPVLEKLALEELLKGKLLPHMESIMSNVHDAITRMERIVASMSGVWYGPEVTVNHSKKLQPLVDCVDKLGRKLEKRQASGVSVEETVGLVRRLKTMLVELNAHDRAKSLLRTFHLKEAI